MMRLSKIVGLVIISVCLSGAGCADRIDPTIQALRQRLVTESEPSDERPIPEIRDGLKSGTIDADGRVVVRARINAGDFPPFAEGTAAFVITDATGHDGDESHNPHQCPFCKRDILSQMARVEFPDESGKVIRIDSRKLFNVKEFDLLVVEGQGRFDEDDMLIITASKMYVRR